MTSWRTIRGLTYSTIGRTLRARVYGSDDRESLVWFDPPNSWRIADADGTPRHIQNESDSYWFSDDGEATHQFANQRRAIVYIGLHPTQLFTMHRYWPEPGLQRLPKGDLPYEPSEIIATSVRGRAGWQINLDPPQGGGTITAVIDAEIGVTLALRQGDHWLEVSDPVLDEVFDPALFTWDGPSHEIEEHRDTREQREHEERARAIQAIPGTKVGWLPTTTHTSSLDGDPLTGALDMVASVSQSQVAIRRWLTGLDEPKAGVNVDSPVRGRTEIGPWTVELRSFAEVSPHDAAHIFSELHLPDPPGSVDDVRTRVADRRLAHEERELTEYLGTGRRLDDYLHAGSYAALLIRTDFTDDDRWREIARATAVMPELHGEELPALQAPMLCIDHLENDGLSTEQLLIRIGDDPPNYAFIADSTSMTNPEMPVLALDCGDPEYDEPGRTFRTIPAELWNIEANLSIANMDFADFARSADDDGVFRGYK